MTDHDGPAGPPARRPAQDGRSTRWDQHRATRRGELVDATLRAVRRHGAAVGMDEIAATAGTSKTVFYRHFTDRAGLYDAVAARVDELILRDLSRALGSTGVSLAEHAGSPRAVLFAAVDSYLRLVERDPEVYRFVVAAPLLAQGRLRLRGDAVGDISRRVATSIAALIAEALEGVGRSSEAAQTWGHAVVGMVRAAADHWLSDPAADGGAPREALAEHLTELIWSGLSPAWSTPSPA